jgi:hypothetical protein
LTYIAPLPSFGGLFAVRSIIWKSNRRAETERNPCTRFQLTKQIVVNFDIKS